MKLVINTLFVKTLLYPMITKQYDGATTTTLQLLHSAVIIIIA